MVAGAQQLATVLADFVQRTAYATQRPEVLGRLCEQATTLLVTDGAGANVQESGQPGADAATDETAAALAQAQERHQEGPRVEALRRGRAVAGGRVSDEKHRWPQFVGAAVALGVASVVVVPLTGGDDPIGVLELYSRQPRHWSAREVAALGALGDVAAGLLLHTAQLDQERRTAAQLQQALDSRVLIEQAKGYLASARGVDVDTAFALLRRYSMDTRTPLRHVAGQVLQEGLRL